MPEPTPLHSQLYAEISARIQSGVWAAGERVPSEKSLSEEFGVSRGPVRQALAALRAEGMIVGGRGAPPRVQRSAPPQSFDTFMSFSEWARSLGQTPGQRVIEASRRLAGPEAVAELELAPDEPVVEIVRLRTLNGAPAMLERSRFPLRVGAGLLAADLDSGSIYQHMREQGDAPVRARHLIDAIAAEPLDATWLAVDAGSPLLRVRRTARGADDRVVEAADDRYVPGMATFAIENATRHTAQISVGRPEPAGPAGPSPRP